MVKIEHDASGGSPMYKLPDDLLLEIGSWLRKRSDLRALVMTNTRFHAVFEHQLYKWDIANSSVPYSLWWAVTESDFVVINKIIKFGCNLDKNVGFLMAGKSTGTTALVEAMCRKNLLMACTLVNAGANVDTAPDSARIPVFLALENKWTDLVRVLVSVRNVNLNFINHRGHGVLTAAARENNLEAVRYLLSISPGPAPGDIETSTALHQAIQHDNFKMFCLLMESRRVSPERFDQQKKTPLQLACELGKLPFVRALLDDGRAVARAHEKNNSPLVLQALKRSNFDLVMLLLAHKNPCRPCTEVFDEACKMKKELIAWTALEIFCPSRLQAIVCRNFAYSQNLHDLAKMITERFY
ncbi:hypothetical protein NLG97_g3996 [Lecanicillium saksenae]|uniref:Uncharacterized protein n=1 Tax=Lecanicillium saksenae TaxID=468837 RepID=A0ACC1QYA8_9HYPO|nr:hypothetical protein NLG97_g3996 [Lecanicillium saksenae]